MFYACLGGETWLLSLMLQFCWTLCIVVLFLYVFEPLVEVACLSIERVVKFFFKYSICFLHLESSKPRFILKNKVIALRDCLALGPWHVRANLDVKAHFTSVIGNLATGRVLRDVGRCYK